MIASDKLTREGVLLMYLQYAPADLSCKRGYNSAAREQSHLQQNILGTAK
ncbi:MAG: hypothetical protein GXX00_14045 [Hungateiclostridium thermocellum]|nr:hypothetical protein [Acetivibrio thermocellus]